VGIRTAESAQAEYDKVAARMVDGEPNITITPIAPFYFTFDAASYSRRFSLHFIQEIPTLGRWEMQFSWNVHSEYARRIGAVNLQYADKFGSKHYGRKRIIDRVSFTAGDRAKVISNAKAETLIYGKSEDRTEPGSVVVYFASHDGEHSLITVDDIAAVLEGDNAIPA
jgi:hypothetical protein